MDVAAVYKKYYRIMPVIPVLLAIILAAFLPSLKLGIDFTGGISISFSSDKHVPPSVIEEALRAKGFGDVTVTPLADGYLVEVAHADVPDPKKLALEAISSVVNMKDVVVMEVVPTLGSEFWSVVSGAALWSVILLLIVILVAFRHPVPIGIMIVSALFDGLAMLSLMGLANIPLSLATISIILMMVGYSIDTDVVASAFIFKRKEGDVFQRAAQAFRTGATMSLTSLGAMVIIFLLGLLTHNPTILRIGLVMVFGLVADIIITWLFNAPILMIVGGRNE